jgi:hypothetical protein
LFEIVKRFEETFLLTLCGVFLILHVGVFCISIVLTPRDYEDPSFFSTPHLHFSQIKSFLLTRKSQKTPFNAAETQEKSSSLQIAVVSIYIKITSSPLPTPHSPSDSCSPFFPPLVLTPQ